APSMTATSFFFSTQPRGSASSSARVSATSASWRSGAARSSAIRASRRRAAGAYDSGSSSRSNTVKPGRQGAGEWAVAHSYFLHQLLQPLKSTETNAPARAAGRYWVGDGGERRALRRNGRGSPLHTRDAVGKLVRQGPMRVGFAEWGTASSGGCDGWCRGV